MFVLVLVLMLVLVLVLVLVLLVLQLKFWNRVLLDNVTHLQHHHHNRGHFEM